MSEEKLALNMKRSSNLNRNIKKGNRGRFFIGRCNHCRKYRHKKADCWDLKSKQENSQENDGLVQKDKSNVMCFKCKKLGKYANECRNGKGKVEMKKHITFAMICCENNEEEKMRMGKKKICKNQRILMMKKEKFILEQ